MKTTRNKRSIQRTQNVQRIITNTSLGLTVEGGRLSDVEQSRLRTYERTITDGLATVFEVGNALMAIKEAQLYRENYPTFEEYCQQRWGFGRSYAWRTIAAAERLNLLPDDGTIRRPANEFQMRPFLKLEPKDFPEAWKQVLERAKDGKITSQLIGGIINEVALTKVGRKIRTTNPTRVSLSKGTIGEIIVLLDQAKRQIQKLQCEEAERAIEQLERVEKLLVFWRGSPSKGSADVQIQQPSTR